MTIKMSRTTATTHIRLGFHGEFLPTCKKDRSTRVRDHSTEVGGLFGGKERHMVEIDGELCCGYLVTTKNGGTFLTHAQPKKPRPKQISYRRNRIVF